MNVDLEAIAQRGRCDVSSLRIALPLLQQGYSPPFLARYRRDELGGLDEASLWALSTAMQTEQAIASRREELLAAWESTPLQDPAIGHAVRKANSKRMLERLGRRLRAETSDHGGDCVRLAVRVLNPHKGDGTDFTAIAEKAEGIEDAAAAVAGLDAALATRLAGDPRLISAAVRWLVKNARIHIATIHDPHIGDEAKPAGENLKQKSSKKKRPTAPPTEGQLETPSPADAETTSAPQADAESLASAPSEAVVPVATTDQTSAPEHAGQGSVAETSVDAGQVGTVSSSESPVGVAEPGPDGDTPIVASSSTGATSSVESAAPTPATPETATPETATPETATPETATPETATPETAAPETSTPETVAPDASKKKSASSQLRPASQPSDSGGGKSAKKNKKISPRQRRRRWLVSVLKPLEGKRLPSGKLSAFQVVMLSRALRSQVAQCSFEYDAARLVAELQRTAGGLNRHIEDKLRDIILQNEADIREAAEGAWWDELQERASTRLVGIAADHLRRQTDRGGVKASVVMSIDAVGPRTAATTIVAADGRLLHSEDLPCQLSASPRSQAVSRMGELIHTYHVDLIVISNGPSRRACMVAVGDLIGQSPAKSLRWTLADRSGADAYAGSSVADQEMRSTPRRFRAAAWLAFSVLQPAQALAKVDPLKLRLGSFQRELSDDALLSTLEDVMISGASRGGVDVNAAPVSWLMRLPGVAAKVAEAIDQSRRSELLASRQAIAELEAWESPVDCRQALPFLRVFESNEVLDGTLIHPDDYPLAKKLAATLEIELPPAAPPGYVVPNYVDNDQPAEANAAPSDTDTDTAAADDPAGATPDEDGADFAADVVQPAADGQALADPSDVEDSTTNDAPASESDAQSLTDDSSAAADASPSSDPQVDDTPAPGATKSEEPPQPDSPPETDSAESPEASEASSPGDDSGPSPVPTPASSAPAAAATPAAIVRPKPEAAKINKCIKEWQVGGHRVRQLVHWLCDPFGDGDAAGVPPAVLSTMPSLSSLHPGDQVVGVIVGVMPFGVFVELAPDCSGLIHVSKVSDGFVEDLHEAVQVGDVVTAWVTGVDEKRRRVALSAISPEREAELQNQRGQRDTRGGGRPPRGGHPSRGGPPRGEQRGASGSDQSRGRPSGGRQGGGGRQSGEKSRGDRGGGAGGRSRDRRGAQRGPESYRVVSKEPAKPITEEMKKGAEPLRSFGDLLQFYSKDDSPPAKQVKPKDTAAEPPNAAPAESAGADVGIAVPAPAVTDSGAPVDNSENPSPPADASEKPTDLGIESPLHSASDADKSVTDRDRGPAAATSEGDGDSQAKTKEPPAPSDTPSS